MVSESLGQGVSFKVYYILTNDFQIFDFSVNDEFIDEYRDKFNRYIFDNYSVRKLYEMFSEIEFWDGKRFTSEPVMSNDN